MIRVLSAMVVVGLLAGSAFAADAKFPLKGDNTKLTFVGTKPDGKHDGSFKELTGSIIADNDPTKLKIEVEIDLNSIETDDPKLTTHLKSPDFFNVKANPKAKFVTTKVEKGNDDYSVTGELTLNGKTKAVTFPAKIKASDDALSLTSSFKINRNDWGISYGKGKINDEVSLSLAVTAKK